MAGLLLFPLAMIWFPAFVNALNPVGSGGVNSPVIGVQTPDGCITGLGWLALMGALVWVVWMGVTG